jgi:hypothetical protein
MLTDRDPFPTGKRFRGRPMEEVPAWYLDWFIGQPWAEEYPQVREYVRRNRKALDLELTEGKDE